MRAPGKAYFAAKCASCHSADGRPARDRDENSRSQDAAEHLGGGRRRGGAAGAPAAAEQPRRTVTVTVTLPSGEKVEGRLVRIDDFLVTVGLADGTMRTFRREGDVPKVDIHDPMKAHRDLLAVYTDKDMHDVTAYLVTLK